MKFYFYFLCILYASVSYAQDINVIYNKTYKHSGKSNPSNLEFDIPDGVNRFGLISVFIERKHSGFNGDNHVIENYISAPDKFFKIKLNQNNIITDALSQEWFAFNSSLNTPTTYSNTIISNYSYSYIVLESQLSKGKLYLNFEDLTVPKDFGDELLINFTVLENVQQKFYPSTRLRGSLTSANSANTLTAVAANGSNGFLPVGRTANDKIYFAYSAISSEENLFVNSGWNNIFNEKIQNTSGSNLSINGSNLTEPNGISVRMDYQRGVSTLPSLTTSRPSNTSTKVNQFYNVVMELNPIGVVNINGKVFQDFNREVNANSIGTNVPAKYVNFINSKGLVIATATIAANGEINVTEGYVNQSEVIRARLSNTKGTIGQAALPVEINSNWRVVNENFSDGEIDGQIIFSTDDQSVSLRFGLEYIEPTSLDFDKDGIPNDIECNSQDRIVGGNFRALNSSLQGNVTSLNNWQLSGTTSSVWPQVSVNINSNGLEFRRDQSTVTSLKQSMQGKNLKNGILTLNDVKWYRTSSSESTDETTKFNFEVYIGGVKYLEIFIVNNKFPVVRHFNGAFSNVSLLEMNDVINSFSEATTIVLELPNDANLHQGELELRFTAGSSSNSVNDLVIGSISLTSCRDTDNDGLQDLYDLDSDNDGCFDAVEGSGNVTNNQLNSNGSINSELDVNGIPTLVNGGQGAGSAYDSLINACVCLKEPNTVGNALPTQIGISTESINKDWQPNINGAFLALQSYDKGLVINDLSTEEIALIRNPVEGMVVYNTDEHCLMIYSKNLGSTNFSWKCFNKQSCQDN